MAGITGNAVIDGASGNLIKSLPIIRTVALILFLIIVFNVALGFIKKALLKRAKSKAQISNIKIFSRILSMVFILFLAISSIFAYSGSWTGFGLAVGLMSAALGWALQRPITGIAAWIMIVVKRPFQIGDRIVVAGVRGDVLDITLTHLYLGEVGGISSSEERSGRVIMVPNSIMFEQNIINFTQETDFILDEVILSVTYESDLDKAKKIVLESANEVLKEFEKQAIDTERPYTRNYFHSSGINVHVRYFTPAMRRQEISSKITQEIFKDVRAEKDVTFAFPHSEVVFKDKDLFKGKK
jgi:small-conductance mechanosensitive channel